MAQKNSVLQKIFQKKQITEFKKNRNIQEIIGGDNIFNGKVVQHTKDAMLPSSNENNISY